MSLSLHNSRVYLNGVDITKEVFSIALNDKPGDLTTVKVELYVQSVHTVPVDGGRPEITYNLGRGK